MLKQPVLAAGIDEVGTSEIAGPIVACVAVFHHPSSIPEGLIQTRRPLTFHDSKSLKRLGFRFIEGWYRKLTELAYEWRVAAVQPKKIDSTNSKRAALEAMRKAVKHLQCTPKYLAVDGEERLDLDSSIRQYPEPKADKHVWQVSSASIIAKYIRDTLMMDLHACIPELQPYRFNTNMGYCCHKHRDALKALGPSKYHRFRYSEVKDAEANQVFHPGA
jgi:ribonuclease HII